MYESDERHEYNADEVKRIVKKKGQRTDEEADVAEAIYAANDVVPKGQAVKVVTETYHHYEQHTLSREDQIKQRRKSRSQNAPTSEERLHLARQRERDNECRKKSVLKAKDRQEYSQGQISLLVKKSKKTSAEEEIAAAIREARQLAPSGKAVKVITENYPPIQTRSAKPKRNKVVPAGDTISRTEDKDYKEIFDFKLLPPLGFYRRGDRYLSIRKRYETLDDGRGVGMADKHWNRQKNFTLRNLFVWPPMFCFRKLFWSFGYYDYAYAKSHKFDSEAESVRKKSDDDDLFSDDDRLRDYDDEVFELTSEDIRRKSLPGDREINGLMDQELHTKGFDRMTKECQKCVPDGDLYSTFTQEELYQFQNKEMLMYPWELDTQTIRKLNRKQLEDYNEVCDFCNTFIGHEEKKLAYIRTHMGQSEYKEFLMGRGRAKSKFVADLLTLAGKNPKLLQEATEKSQGLWEGVNLRSLLILEYGLDVVNSLDLPRERKGTEGEEKRKRNSAEQDNRVKKKSINWTTGVDGRKKSSMGDNADNRLMLRNEIRIEKEKTGGDKRKGKAVELKPRMEGEGEKETLGKIRRGTKHGSKMDKMQYDDDEDGEDDNRIKNITVLPGLNKQASVAFIRRYSVTQIEKNKFKTNRLKWTNPREPKAKEAELWNSLPKNPKFNNETMIVARLPQDASASDLRELFPTGKVTIKDPPGDNAAPYATVEFPNYETCRVAYDRVRNVTYDEKPLVAIPKPVNDSEEELQTFLRYCK